MGPMIYMESPAKHRQLAWGGVVGPAAFVSAWIVSGALRHGYSPVEAVASRLAAVGTPRRLIMTAGFVAFGTGVPVSAAVLRDSVAGPAIYIVFATGAVPL